MSFIQLPSPVPVTVAGKGRALAFGLIGGGDETELFWVSTIEDTGEVCLSPGPAVRFPTRDDCAPCPEDTTDGEPLTALKHAVHIPGADAEDSAFP